MPNDLNQIVNEALVLFKEGHHGIQFQFGAGDLPPVELDRDQMKRVLMNLLDNAVAAVEGRGEIKLATSYERARGVVTLEVADNGCGLAPELRTKIFEPYFSTKENGTGLGLTIVSQIVEDHRGYIRAWPNDPQGTRITIELPAHRDAGVQILAKSAVH
jgi:two-component system nitrogen regulation sensor histidine kinase NtrY